MNTILYWTCKILTFGMFQKGDSIDFPTIMIMTLTLIGIIGITITIITCFSDKSNEQDQKIQQLEDLLIDHANKRHIGIIDTLLDPTPEIKQVYQQFRPEERDNVIYQILQYTQNSDDNNTALLLMQQQTNLNNINNINNMTH